MNIHSKISEFQPILISYIFKHLYVYYLLSCHHLLQYIIKGMAVTNVTSTCGQTLLLYFYFNGNIIVYVYI